MRSGRRARHALLHVAVRSNGLPESRLGFSVGKRVGKAVIRNRVKRRLRAIMRELPIRSGFDVVAVAHEGTALAPYQVLRDAAARCLQGAGALKRASS